jgi:1-acyl-sn-glycerol-3-phosphate acyltransferase
MAGTSRDAFAAGAARAAGERRKRNSTPLVGADGMPSLPADEARSAPHRPVPQGTPTASANATTVDAVVRERRPRPVLAGLTNVGEATVTQLPTSRASDRAASSTRLAPTRRAGRRARRDGLPITQAALTPAVTAPVDLVATEASAVAPPPSAAEVAAEVVAGSNAPVVADSVPAAPPRPRGDRTGTAYRSRVRAPEQSEISESLLASALTQQELTPDIEDIVAAIIGVLRTVAAASGLGADEVEQAVARTLAFLRRRLTGDYSVDDFGLDPDYIENIFMPLMRLLYRQWFRVEVRGIENIPADGSALIVANHSGTIALDSHMVQVAIHDEHPAARHLRLLGADLVFRTPVMGSLARKQGATLAANSDAERLLSAGEIVGVFPEGFKGVGKPFSERYKLQRFGRGGFVSAAVRTGAPIIPCSIIGAEETYPLLGDVKVLARLFGAPYFPVTPTWPWLGPLGLVPLPSKWIMEFGEPVETARYGAAGADDPMLVFDLTDQVRETIQQTLYSLLMQRRSVFS